MGAVLQKLFVCAPIALISDRQPSYFISNKMLSLCPVSMLFARKFKKAFTKFSVFVSCHVLFELQAFIKINKNTKVMGDMCLVCLYFVR